MIKFLSSTRITVVCLFLLFILTFWGTVAQVEHGLFAAQERYFNSFFFLAAGWMPFPGSQLVLWVLFINLMAATVTRFSKYRNWSYAGILIIHFGLLLYFLAAFMVFHLAKESNIHLREGQSTNVSVSYMDWELAYWKQDRHEAKQIAAFDANHFRPDQKLPVGSKDFTLAVKQFYLNCDAFSDGSGKKNPRILNASGITMLTPKTLLKEREQNTAGGVFTLSFDGKNYTLILFGSENRPTPVDIAGETYYFSLRLKRHPLPFSLKLDDFKADFHTGTAMARSFESFVTITTGTLERQVRIYMNNPFRFKDYTVYQASYSVDKAGREYSTLAVVKNGARILPYVACLIVFAGLALHFLIRAFQSRTKT